MTQLPLFNQPLIARRRDPATSRTAAERIAPKLPAIQQALFEYIAAHPGCTGAEIGLVSESMRKRLNDLEAKGKIYWRGVRKSSVSGHDGRQWFVKH